MGPEEEPLAASFGRLFTIYKFGAEFRVVEGLKGRTLKGARAQPRVKPLGLVAPSKRVFIRFVFFASQKTRRRFVVGAARCVWPAAGPRVFTLGSFWRPCRARPFGPAANNRISALTTGLRPGPKEKEDPGQGSRSQESKKDRGGRHTKANPTVSVHGYLCVAAIRKQVPRLTPIGTSF